MIILSTFFGSFIFIAVFITIIVLAVISAIKKSGQLTTKVGEVVKDVTDTLTTQITPPPPQKRFCDYCGSVIAEEQTKCASCGAPIKK